MLRERAREAIRGLIASGTLRAGDRLAEAYLSTLIGIGRSPIREALRELEQQGLVVSSPNRGCAVASLGDEDAEEIVVIRAWLEGLAARLAADRMARRDFARLEEFVDDLGRACQAQPPSMQAIVEADAAFHASIVSAAGNRRLSRIWEGLDPLMWLLRLRSGEHHFRRVADRLADEHRQVVDALRAGPDEAEGAARDHVLLGSQSVRAMTLPVKEGRRD
jgi:DNA-binding GntR family transcriptional regulator